VVQGAQHEDLRRRAARHLAELEVDGTRFDGFGIGGAIAESLESLGLPLIVAGFVIAAIVRMAQGSATVALTTAAALVQPAVQAATDLNAGQLAAMVLALAAGSVFAGHVNDSGFWLVSRFFGMDTATTLKTWTVGQALIGIVGFVGALAIYGVAAGIA
jgi:GntP family gluconate:H+ symporter